MRSASHGEDAPGRVRATMYVPLLVGTATFSAYAVAAGCTVPLPVTAVTGICDGSVPCYAAAPFCDRYGVTPFIHSVADRVGRA